VCFVQEKIQCNRGVFNTTTPENIEEKIDKVPAKNTAPLFKFVCGNNCYIYFWNFLPPADKQYYHRKFTAIYLWANIF
jgi:hypothetical protein